MAKKTIAIIGATEMMGTAIAKNLSKAGYRLLLIGDHDEKLQSLVAEIKHTVPSADIECLQCLIDASWEADIIVLALPWGVERKIAERIREVATQKIVIICSCQENHEQNNLITPRISTAEEVQRMLPHSKIVKTFNNTLAADISRCIAAGEDIDSFIAGNDPDAVQTVREIISNAGFHPIIAGELATSRVLENNHGY